MKLFIILSSILSVAVAQSVRCSYVFNIVYMCQLTITNPNGFNNFTSIPGIHVTGFGDADVEYVQAVSGSSTIVPSIICSQFPNVGYLSLFNMGLTSIGDTAFNGCLRVKSISMQMNRISSVSVNAFVNNREVEYLGLGLNNLATLPENVFANQQNLLDLYLGSNPFQNIPTGLFRPLENVISINLDSARITAINNQWFAHNAKLDYLSFAFNTIVLNANSFLGLSGLNGINLNENGITNLPSGTFAPLTSLEYLYLSKNRLPQLPVNSFTGLGNLLSLDLSGNPLNGIASGTFRQLTSLEDLDLTFTGLTTLNANSFEGLGRLLYIILSTNQIQTLPNGLFAQSPLLENFYILNNRLSAIRRTVFGSVSRLSAIAVEGNSINAIDKAVIDEAVNLNYLYMNGNVCANFFFHTFMVNRAQYMPMLQTCFNNALL